MPTKYKLTSYRERLNSLPAERRQKVEAEGAKILAEYEAKVAADRAAGKVPPEDLPIDESIFGTIPRPATPPRRKSPKGQAKHHAGKLVAAK